MITNREVANAYRHHARLLDYLRRQAKTVDDFHEKLENLAEVWRGIAAQYEAEVEAEVETKR